MATDPRMLTFLRTFARTLDPLAASRSAQLDPRTAAENFQRSKALQKRLAKLFEERVALFDHVPLAVVRLELLSILANQDIQPGHRVAAGKLLTELIGAQQHDGKEAVGKLLRAVRNASEE